MIKKTNNVENAKEEISEDSEKKVVKKEEKKVGHRVHIL